MDREIEKFLGQIPKGGVVLDIGMLGLVLEETNIQRPDITVVIVDLVRENLLHAKEVLKEQVTNKAVSGAWYACSLEFEDNTFDGIWSVQTSQHIPDLEVHVERYTEFEKERNLLGLWIE